MGISDKDRGRWFVLTIWLLTLAAAAAADQRNQDGQRPAAPQGQPSTPPRDTRQPRSGTARLSGRVLSAESGSPLRRAQVRLVAPVARENRLTSTDSDGRYQFTDLPSGRYTLTVSKGGYITLQYGQVRPFEPGKPIEIADGRTIDRVDFALPRGSVIAGRIADEFGEPVAEASVQAMRYQFVNGERRLVTAGRGAMSDDIGQFRIFGLAPGEYVVRASIRNAGAQSPVNDASGYPPTYYPGTNNVAEAQPLNVTLGQELATVHFSLVPARLSRVSGIVVDSQGRPLSTGIVTLRQIVAGALPMNVAGGSQIAPKGSFMLPNLAPGEYLVEVSPRPRDVGLAEIELASVPLTVSGEDITGLVIVSTPGTSVSGRVLFEGKAPSWGGNGSLQVLAVAPAGLPSFAGRGGRRLGSGQVDADGTFELHGLIG